MQVCLYVTSYVIKKVGITIFSFYGEFENEKKKTFLSGDLNRRFSVIFPPMVLIFMESEGDEIKSRQGS